MRTRRFSRSRICNNERARAGSTPELASTSAKTRYLAHNQQLLRVDSETVSPLGEKQLEKLVANFESAVPRADVAILSDYGKGVLSETHARCFITAGRAAGKPVYVDPKGHDFRRYYGASLIKPNLRELAEATKM